MPMNRKTNLLVLVLVSFMLFASALFPQSTPGLRLLEARLASVSGEERLESLVELTTTYAEKEPKKVLEYGQEALALLKKFPSAQRQVAVLNGLSTAASLLGEAQQAQSYAWQSLSIAQGMGDRLGEADAFANLTQGYLAQGEYKQALEYCEKARGLYEKTSQLKGVAHSFYLKAFIYWRMSDLSRATDYVLKAYEIFKKSDDRKGKALLDMLSANIYSDQGLYEKALEYHLKARLVFEAAGEKERLNRILNNIGYIYTKQENYQEALSYYEKSLKISQEINSRQTKSFTLNNIGEVHAKKGNYSRALDYFNNSLEIKEDLNDQMGIAFTLVNIGSVYRQQGLYREALPPLQRALAIADKINTRNEIRSANKELSTTYAALNRYQEALYHLQKYKEVNDFIFNETSSQKISERQTYYEKENQEKEITLLRKNNAIYHLTLKRQKTFNFFIITASLLLLIVGFVIYTRYRLKINMSRALTREIAEHRQTTQRLQESEETFRILAESAVVGIYIIQDNVIQYINPKFLEIFSCQGEEVIGKSPLEFVREEDKPLVAEKITQRLAGSEESLCYEFRGGSRAGEILQLESYGGLIHFQGRPAVLETIIDITARKKTAEKLLKSKKLEAMGLLVGGIAHDFNNLLGVLVGYLEMIKDEIETHTPIYRLVENIEKSYTQAADLSQRLASFAKGRWIVPQKITLYSILTAAVSDSPEISPFINNIDIPEDLKFIHGDQRQLKQAFIYLFCQTWDTANRNGEERVLGLQINITAENIWLEEGNEFLLEKGDYIRVFLSDINRYIPAEQLEKIFEPSFSVPSLLTQKGMGLELAICHSIIKKHNGHIAASSEPGKGTTFDILLPAYYEPIPH